MRANRPVRPIRAIPVRVRTPGDGFGDEIQKNFLRPIPAGRGMISGLSTAIESA
jgi:hypothetical protein